MASIWDKFKNATPFDELANAGVAAARGIGNVAGQGAYGLGRAAGTGVNLYGQALGRMAGMGMDAAGMGMDAAQGLGRYGMQGAQALGNAELDNLRRQASMVGNVAQGVGGAAMGASRGFMEGVRGPEAGMGRAGGMLRPGMMDAIRKMQLQNQQGPMTQVRMPGVVPQMPMPIVRNSYGAPGRYGG